MVMRKSKYKLQALKKWKEMKKLESPETVNNDT